MMSGLTGRIDNFVNTAQNASNVAGVSDALDQLKTMEQSATQLQQAAQAATSPEDKASIDQKLGDLAAQAGGEMQAIRGMIDNAAQGGDATAANVSDQLQQAAQAMGHHHKHHHHHKLEQMLEQVQQTQDGSAQPDATSGGDPTLTP